MRKLSRLGRRAAIAAATAVAAVFVGTLEGCAASPWSGISCDFVMQNPHQSSGSPKYMDGKATFSCKGGVVTNVTVKIKLQKRQTNGSWTDVAGSANSIEKSQLQSGQKVTITTGANLACKAGRYRTGAWGKGTYKGVTKSSPNWQYQEADVTCK